MEKRVIILILICAQISNEKKLEVIHRIEESIRRISIVSSNKTKEIRVISTID